MSRDSPTKSVRACSAILTPTLSSAVVEEAGRFATDVIAPLNRVGDVEGARCVDGVVTSPKGFREAYKAWAEGGWSGVTASPEFGGMGLPHSVNFACGEIWNGASMGFALCPLLTEGAIGALSVHASPELRETYMRRNDFRRMDGHDEPHRGGGGL